MERCPLCPSIHAIVPADGPCNDYIFIAEAPGFDENKQGRPFVGKTGKEVNDHYLPLAGFRRTNCRFTNVIQCLRGDTLVVMADGTTQRIAHLFRSGFNGFVLS